MHGILIHAASVGEVQAAEALIRALRNHWPDHTITVTTQTPTGARKLQALFGDALQHFFFPVDTPGATARFLDRLAAQPGGADRTGNLARMDAAMPRTRHTGGSGECTPVRVFRFGLPAVARPDAARLGGSGTGRRCRRSHGRSVCRPWASRPNGC